MAANTTDLGFNVFALDKASKTFVKMAQKVEQMSDKLDELDRKDATPEINVDTDKGMRNIRKFSKNSSGIMAGAMKIVSARALLMSAVVVAAIAAAPAAAAVAATGIVTAFGGALVAVGIIAAAQNKKVKQEFTDLKDHVVSTAKEISRPFRSTLMTVADVARDVFDSIASELEGIFKDMAPGLSSFVRDMGAAFKQLSPALKPLADAFNEVLRRLGPQMKPLFEDIAAALTAISGTVKENASEFTSFITLLLQSIPAAIRLVDFLSQKFVDLKNWFTSIVEHPLIQWALAKLQESFNSLRNTIDRFAPELSAIRDGLTVAFGTGVIGMIGGFLEVLGTVISVIGRIARAIPPIGITWTNAIIVMLTATKSWVNQVLDGVSVVLAAMATIPGGVGAAAEKALEGFGRFRRGVNTTFDAAINEVHGWNSTLRNAKKTLRLRGNIRDLKQKISEAKSQLQDPDLTDPERSKIRARINQLQSQVQQAKNELNSIPDESVSIFARWHGPGAVSGVLPQRQHGGPVQKNRPFLVGEAGPELFVPRQNGQVVSNSTLTSSSGGSEPATIRISDSEAGRLIVTLLQRTARTSGVRVELGRV